MSASPIVKYGVATPAEIEGLTGRQILQSMIDGRLPAPPIARPLTFWLIEVGDGLAIFEGEPGEHLLNPMGGVHGGWALTLIDSACGCAGMTTLTAGASYASLETKANFNRPITKDTGRVRCEGRVVSKGRQIISTEAKVLSVNDKVLAHGTSTLMVFGRK
jgi:uncharacterized protein (TIGR00369 family)